MLDQKEDRVGETPGQCSVGLAVDDREAEWILLDRRKDLFDRRQELLAESLPLALVPVEGLDQLRLGLWPDAQLPSHQRLRIRDLTSGQGELSPGLR